MCKLLLFEFNELKYRTKNNLCVLLVMAILAGHLGGLPSAALAVSEGALATSFAGQVQPFFEENFTLGSFQGTAGVTLPYAKRQVPNPRGIMVLVNGRTEFMAKYAELCYDLRDLPWSIYLYDQRGQGRSDRLLAEHDKGHVVKFDDYVADLSFFIDTVVQPDRTLPLLLLTHSMGGTVAALYANAHAETVQGLILSSPMLAINTAPLPAVVARLLAQSASCLGFAASFVPGGRPYNPAKPFSTNDVTHSQARFGLNQRLVAEAPANALGSPTFGWVDQALAGMDNLTADHQHLTMPVLLLRAGADTVVQTPPQAALCGELPDCTLVEMPGARHEILMEEDGIRNRAIAAILDFIEGLVPVQHQQGLNGTPVQQQQGLNGIPPAAEASP